MQAASRILVLKAGLLRGLGSIALVILSALNVVAAPAANPEYQIKAVFLFNFLQFVEWPANAFSSSDAPLQIGILGSDPFGPVLEQAIQGETIWHRPLVVERSDRIEDLKHCQLLFVSRSEKGHLSEIFSQLSSNSTLTVSETDGFARRGGVINFYLDGKKVRFEINPNAAQNHGLKLSSQLLGLGKIVEPEEPRK